MLQNKKFCNDRLSINRLGVSRKWLLFEVQLKSHQFEDAIKIKSY